MAVHAYVVDLKSNFGLSGCLIIEGQLECNER
jgi:hypothetical protein